MVYRRLRFNIIVSQSSSLANVGQRKLYHVILGVVVCHIAITSQKIRTGDFTVVVKDLLASRNRFDCLHNKFFFFLEQPRLINTNVSMRIVSYRRKRRPTLFQSASAFNRSAIGTMPLAGCSSSSSVI